MEGNADQPAVGGTFTDPFFILIASGILTFLIIGLIVAAIIILKMKAGKEEDKILHDLLSDEEIRSKIGENELSSILQFIQDRETQMMQAQSEAGVIAILRNISSSISWDVPGVIGTIVTVALLAMTLAGQWERVPEYLSAAWLTIIGFYFGRMQQSQSG